jgi:hypothetical protein
MNCKEAKNYISPYMDGELDGSLAQEFAAHLEECESCHQSYQEMVQISRLFQSAGKNIIPAPEIFKDSVMDRIVGKSGHGRAGILVRLGRSWKQAAASAAAIALLAFTSYTYALPPLVQLAERNEKPPMVSQNAGSSNPAANSGSDMEPVNNDPGVADPDSQISSQDNNNNTPPEALSGSQEPVKPETSDDPAPPVGENLPFLLSEDQRNIKTTLLKVAIQTDMASSYNRAVGVAQGFGAQIENLGQQSKDEITYQQVKIVVNRDNEASLMASLRSLGDIITEQDDYKDISTAYQNTLDQYYNLTQDRAGSDDAAEISRLESEIKSQEYKLVAFQQQAAKVTIVLWLQQ